MKKKIIIAVFSCVIIGAVLFFVFNNGSSYKKAYENTKNLKNYTMNISTTVTVTDGAEMKQSCIDQVLKVENKGDTDMIYSVESSAGTGDETAQKEENSYIYYNNAYYYSYPGVKYKGPTERLLATENIEKLSSVILFEEDKIAPYSAETNGDETFYTYQVSYDDVSDFVKAMLESAVNSFEGEKFSLSAMTAGSTEEKGFITAGEFYVEYRAESGNSIIIEIYTDLTDETAEIEKPDESKYANIYG